MLHLSHSQVLNLKQGNGFDSEQEVTFGVFKSICDLKTQFGAQQT